MTSVIRRDGGSPSETRSLAGSIRFGMSWLGCCVGGLMVMGVVIRWRLVPPSWVSGVRGVWRCRLPGCRR